MKRKETTITGNNGLEVAQLDVQGFVEAVAAAESQRKNATSQQQKIRDAALRALEALGGLTVQDDALVFEGEKFILPEMYEGRPQKAVEFLEDWIRQQTKKHEISKEFPFRPYDVAAAFERTLRLVFGTSGFGQSTMTIFGPQPPRLITVPISTTETIQVPWGKVSLPILDCVFTVGWQPNDEFGNIGLVTAEVPRKYRQHIEGFFVKLEEELRKNSIYKGKAIDGAEHPNFISTKVDPKRVVYSDDVLLDAETHIWLALREPDRLKANGLPIKRQVLIEGPFGTGKTLLGLLTAQEAIAGGFTFIQVRPGKDNLFEALKTAQLYAPALVWFEDLDTKQQGDEDHISKLLDVLDGMEAKTGSVIACFTTNYVQKIQKGVMRPGRLDAVIHIGDLDASGFKKLVLAHIPTNLLGDIDWDAVTEAFAGFPPAFNVEAINRAIRYMLNRTRGGQEEVIATSDLVSAAHGLRRQLELMNGAQEGANEPQVGELIVRDLSRGLKVDARGSLGEVLDLIPTPGE